MSEEKKIIELNDEELEKVSGGDSALEQQQNKDPNIDTIQELENATYYNTGSMIYYNGKTYYATDEYLTNPATGNLVIVYVTRDDSEAKLFVRYQ